MTASRAVVTLKALKVDGTMKGFAGYFLKSLILSHSRVFGEEVRSIWR